jgi:flagellar hook-basal body complex protein FliE
MTPLSALNYLTSPQVTGGAGLPKLPEQFANAPIPSKELESLKSPQVVTSPALPSISSGGHSFSNMLGDMVREVGAKQSAAGEAVSGLLSGQNVSLHQAMIAMEEASVSFQLMVEVRNKLLESYQELMRMQI